MGRIKSLMVKRAAKQLLDGENEFDGTFEKNKKLLGRTMPSKSIRNKIAGYIARLKKAEKVKADRAEKLKVSF
jgi:ribosomal protein S17E